MADLRKKYPSDNPLIGLELERIAKLNVQLKRIQQFIDAAFLIAEDHSLTDEALMDLLGMTEEEKLDARQINANSNKGEIKFDLEMMEICAEISDVDTETFKKPQDFLTHTPLLCKYLYREASLSDASIDHFISKYLEGKLSGKGPSSRADGMLRSIEQSAREKFDLQDRIKELKQGIIREEKGITTPTPPPQKDVGILETNIKRLQEATKLIKELSAKSIRTNNKLFTFSQIRQVDHIPIKLEYDNLDKLFRYQTSIQRQLSTAIGELISLNRP